MTATRTAAARRRRDAEPSDATQDATAAPRSVPPLGVLCGLAVVFVAALIGTAKLRDNSFLTHLATGRLLLDEGVGQLWGGMSDPYTYTSGGRDWIVQSWFASVLYAGAEDLAGAFGVRLLTAATCGVLGALAWRLTRPAGSLLPRVALAGAVLVVGASTWTSRPFMFGLVCFALTLLAAEGGLRMQWLVPVGWLWVNTHGSFPLGVVALVLLALGRRLDGERPAAELSALRWLLAGIVAGGVLNPVGPALLWFPVTLLGRSDTLAHIVEWESPDFATQWARVFLVVTMAGIVALSRRPSYRSALPVAVFLGTALLAMRNVHVALLAYLPALSPALAGLGSIRGDERRPVLRPAVVLLAVATPVVVVGASLQGAFEQRGYPVAALEFLDERDLLRGNARVVTQDYVGNFLELELGRDAAAFIDDRYELHDDDLVADYRTLNGGKDGWDEVLERREVDVVVWERDTPLGSLLRASPEWQVAYDDTTAPPPEGVDAAAWVEQVEAKAFLVACRRDFTSCGLDS